MAEKVRLYHRLAPASEKEKVRASGLLWGKAKSGIAGGGPAMVKAYFGRLPAGKTGYTFSTQTAPTRYGMHFGMQSAEWHEGGPGVRSVEPGSEYVMIEVEVLDNDLGEE
jgi:hypothetical protein